MKHEVDFQQTFYIEIWKWVLFNVCPFKNNLHLDTEVYIQIQWGSMCWTGDKIIDVGTHREQGEYFVIFGLTKNIECSIEEVCVIKEAN